MHLKNPLLFGLMAILLLGGTITPAISQSSPGLGIVVNEVEMNPAGSDAGLGVGGTGINSKTTHGLSGSQEYVELYNPSSQEVDISGWYLVPTSSWKKLEIPSNTIIAPNSFLAFTHVNYWFNNFGDSVSLYDSNDNLIDETPVLKDQDDNAASWQRITDGLDTDTESDWELKRMSPKSSNGKIVEEQQEEFIFSGFTDKTNYTFGEYVVISGSVSEKLYTEKPYFSPELVKISITGPDFFKNIALFPQSNLEYSTELNIQKVYGVNAGDYNVKISYGENIIETEFTVNDAATSSSIEDESEILEIFTDKESYIPGETVILSADTNSSIEYGGLYYTVTNPEGVVIFDGTIFPNERFSTVYQSGSGQIYPFSAQLFMSNVNPVYGTYEIKGIFKHQNTFSTNPSSKLEGSASFTLSEDVKEDVPISLTTDKSLYEIGEIVQISGRSNDVWTEDIELTIEQTSIFHRTTTTSSDNPNTTANPFSYKDSLRLDGDGRFSFELNVIDGFSNSEDNSHLLGAYKISVSEYFGDASVVIKFVENPESYEDERTPLGLNLDNSEYVLGTAIKLSGSIVDYEHHVSNNLRNSVEIKFVDENNRFISFLDHQGSHDGTNCNTNDCEKYSKPLVFTAIPDAVGNFEIDAVLYPNQFDYGSYTIKALYPATGITESVDFDIVSAQDAILSQDESEPPLVLEIEKDVYYVGEKLIINGKVIPKDVTTLTSTSANPSAQTQGGHSYSTNYAQAAMNYVEVSIPYPTSMSIVKSSNYKTIPDEGENYTGGGGTGSGGAYYEDSSGNVVRGDEDKATSRSDESNRTGYDGTAVLNKQKKLLTDMNFKAYPDNEGKFSGVFELRAGIFSTGTYLVKANYFGYYTEQTVTVIDNTLKGGLPPKVVLTLDKSEYIPGETVRINGKIENAYYYDMVSLKVNTPDNENLNCFAGQQCGIDAERKIRVQEGVEGPTFFMNYNIPSTQNSIGTYSILADTHFGQTEIEFFVISESEVIGKTSPSIDSDKKSNKIIEKFNRISDSIIPISLDEKSSEELTLVPRVIQGSLFTSARGEESSVNLRVNTIDGQCVIGQASDCLVSESTRKPGAIYSIVTIDDVNYKIRYSGNDVRLEKFSIVPEESGTKINIDNWNVKVEKDEQPSRFYYKVSYVTLE